MAKAKIIQFPGCTSTPAKQIQNLSSSKRVTMWADVMKIVAYSIQICYLISLFFHK